MPLPPYIKRSGRLEEDVDRYQTVYARSEGAVAAPTAGFHFTPSLLERLEARGVERLEIVLHVGWGTFRPIRDEEIARHRMLPEWYEVSPEAAERLNRARAEGRRIVAVGTTVVRTLETVCDPDKGFQGACGESDLFIVPGYRFKAIDALITNFHLPDSTPLLLANAFYAHRAPASRSNYPFVLKSAYETAVHEGYRFYSYGDAMLIQ
jgi:S-adenosylmethionine:tRNA ribosyltransferase-isomerase